MSRGPTISPPSTPTTIATASSAPCATSGFNIPSYFDGTAFPVPVDHRALGNVINAHCRGNTLSNGIGSWCSRSPTFSPSARHRRRLACRAAPTGRPRHSLGPCRFAEFRLRPQRRRQHRGDPQRSRHAIGARPLRQLPLGQHRTAARSPGGNGWGWGGANETVATSANRSWRRRTSGSTARSAATRPHLRAGSSRRLGGLSDPACASVS